MSEPAARSMQGHDERKERAAEWAAEQLGLKSVRLIPVSADASFRRYFRCRAGGRSLILMDAPPEREDSAPFLDVAVRLHKAGLRAPEILAFDLEQGFGLLEDFGDTLYREVLDSSHHEPIDELLELLRAMAARVATHGLPEYSDQLLQQELELFPDWYLARHKGRGLNSAERAQWQSACALLLESAAQQPRAFVHRDFHSCNLLHTPSGPAIIDFQDAVRGPVSYDFVSLVWDRYISWPRQRIEGWMRELRPALAPTVAEAEWIRCCDWMGLQRNLKIVGIFARLAYRDGKQDYLELIPRFYDYLRDVAGRYRELQALSRLLEQSECAP
ncbi:MAG: phosphotransferase [Xanthomonadales bacterium]|nr:phosphotransferase [Xanthomonadales bacterium]